jgi:dethiobiotin synthetase
VSARLLEHLSSQGLSVAARKPVQSFAPGEEITDADLLAAASGEEPAVVCPLTRRYAAPLAPPMAASALGVEPPRLGDLVAELAGSWPAASVDVGLVEGAGGVASPLADDGDSADLARALAADALVVVADPGLGVIHAARLACAHLEPLRVVVHLNRFDPDSELHAANRDWLADRDGFTVTTDIPPLGAALLTS